MLVDLIAFGVEGLTSDEVEVGTGTVTADADQTVILAATAASGGASSGIPVAAKLWREPFDPADRSPRAYDFGALLDTGETIAEVVRITMSAIGAALGVLIDTDDDRIPIIDTGGEKAQVWFKVDEDFQANAAFSGAGTQVGVSMLIRTSATPFREYERTAVLLVRQQ